MNSTTTTMMTVPSEMPPSSESTGGGSGVSAATVEGEGAGSSEPTAGSGLPPLPSSIVVTWTPDECVTVSVRNAVSRAARGYVQVGLVEAL